MEYFAAPPSSSDPELAVSTPVLPDVAARVADEGSRRVPLWRRVLSFPVFLAALVVGAAFISASWRDQPLGKLFTQGDTWWHLAVGERILATHTFPMTESYSFTAPGTPWIAYEWFPDVLAALAARLGGLVGLSALLLMESATFFLLLCYYARLRSGDWKAALVTVAAVLPVSGVFVSLRPQMVGFTCLVLTLICLEHFRAGRQNALWWLPPIFVLWVNSHGTFVVGLAVIALYWAAGLFDLHHGWVIFHRWTEAQKRWLAFASLLSVLALCVTPYGTRVGASPLEYTLFLAPARHAVTEWQPVNLGESYGKALVLIVLLVLAAQALRPVRHRIEDLIFFLVSAFYSCLQQRFLIVFAVAAVPMIADICAQFVPRYDPAKDKPVLNAVLIAALAIAGFLLFPRRHELASAMARVYPADAVHYLQQNPARHLWNEDTWGGYLIWASGGKARNVFLDGRLDVYQYAGVLSDYQAITNLEPNTLFLLDKYRIDAVLIHQDHPLITYLLATTKWECTYQDDVAVVLRRVGLGARNQAR